MTNDNETRNKKQETRNKKQETRNSNVSQISCQGIVVVGSGKIKVINPDSTDERICRTLKSQYFKNSLANIFHHGSFGCTGVLVDFR